MSRFAIKISNGTSPFGVDQRRCVLAHDFVYNTDINEHRTGHTHCMPRRTLRGTGKVPKRGNRRNTAESTLRYAAWTWRMRTHPAAPRASQIPSSSAHGPISGQRSTPASRYRTSCEPKRESGEAQRHRKNPWRCSVSLARFLLARLQQCRSHSCSLSEITGLFARIADSSYSKISIRMNAMDALQQEHLPASMLSTFSKLLTRQQRKQKRLQLQQLQRQHQLLQQPRQTPRSPQRSTICSLSTSVQQLQMKQYIGHPLTQQTPQRHK